MEDLKYQSSLRLVKFGNKEWCPETYCWRGLLASTLCDLRLLFLLSPCVQFLSLSIPLLLAILWGHLSLKGSLPFPISCSDPVTQLLSPVLGRRWHINNPCELHCIPTLAAQESSFWPPVWRPWASQEKVPHSWSQGPWPSAELILCRISILWSNPGRLYLWTGRECIFSPSMEGSLLAGEVSARLSPGPRKGFSALCVREAPDSCMSAPEGSRAGNRGKWSYFCHFLTYHIVHLLSCSCVSFSRIQVPWRQGLCFVLYSNP